MSESVRTDFEIVSPEDWLVLAGREGVFRPVVYGFTHRAETRVWEEREFAQHTIYFCMHNGFRVAFHNRIVNVRRGDFIWIMPRVANETRLLASNRAFRTYFFRFRLDRPGSTTPIRLQQDWVYRPDAWRLLPHLRDIVSDLQSPRAFHDLRNRASLVLIAASALEAAEPQQRSVLTAQQRLAIHAYMETYTSKRKITPQMLADEAGLSMPYFSRIFRHTYGMTPKHWIVHYRITLAATILSETQMTAKEVAYRVGCRDRFLFSRQFKEIMGISTRQFRRGSGARQTLVKTSRNSLALRDALTDDKKARRRRARRRS